MALQEPEDEAGKIGVAPPAHRLIASLESAHGVYDVNAVSWCPREGQADLLASAGDDGATRVWRVEGSEA